MFSIGDKIFYPMHGVGVIEGIEKKTVLEEEREYYIIRIACKGMNIMVPVYSCEDIGMRYISDPSTVAEVIKLLSAPSTPMSANWNKRNRQNTDKLKTGDIFDCAEVVRNLMRQDRAKSYRPEKRGCLTMPKRCLQAKLCR